MEDFPVLKPLKRLLGSSRALVAAIGIAVMAGAQYTSFPPDRIEKFCWMVVTVVATLVGSTAVKDGLRGMNNGLPKEADKP